MTFQHQYPRYMQRFFNIGKLAPTALWALLILFSNGLVGQRLDFDEIQVIAPYEPSISDAFKINMNPRIEDTLQVDIQFDYQINPSQIPVRFDFEPLSPARMRGEPLAKLYKGYVKAGMGNYATPYAEAFYNTLRSNEYAYGARVRHFSSSGDIDDYGHSAFSDNKINLYGKRFLRNHTLHADLNFERNVVHYYGFLPEEFPEDQMNQLSNKDLRQHFNYISPRVGIQSNYLDSDKLQHSVDLQYYYLTDRHDALEHNVNIRSSLEKSLGEDPMGFAEAQVFHMDVLVDYYKNQNELDTAHTALFALTPRLASSYKDFNFYVGINTAIQADNVSYIKFHPVASAEVNLINNVLFAYTSLTGKMEKHSMFQYSRVNPFINTANMPLAFMNTKSRIQGGMRGSISSFASYNVSVSSSNIENYPFFISDFGTDLNNQFAVVYDDVRIFNFRTELFSNIGERVQVRFASDYFEYTTDEQERAWHEPTVKLNLNLRYNIQNKIIFTADAYARNSVYAKIPSATDPAKIESVKIHGFHVDASFGVEYRYTQILSVFLNFNNVQNQPLERWYNYPSQRFNILGGVSYAF